MGYFNFENVQKLRSSFVCACVFYIKQKFMLLVGNSGGQG